MYANIKKAHVLPFTENFIVWKMMIAVAIMSDKKRANRSFLVALREMFWQLEAVSNCCWDGEGMDARRGGREKEWARRRARAHNIQGTARYRWIMHNRGNGPLRRFKSHKCIARLFPRTRTVLSGHSLARLSRDSLFDSRFAHAKSRGKIATRICADFRLSCERKSVAK